MAEHEEREFESASPEEDEEEEDESVMDVNSEDASGDGDSDEDDEEDESQQPRSHRETMVLHADDLLHPLEAKVEQLAQEITTADPPLLDDELSTKLNMFVTLLCLCLYASCLTLAGIAANEEMLVCCCCNFRIAETLEDVETSFRKERTSPYRREGAFSGLYDALSLMWFSH